MTLLSEQHVRALFAAASSREMIKRSWLLDTMTTMSSYEINHTVDAKLVIGKTVEIEKALCDAELGQVICLNKTHLGIVTKDESMLLTVGVLGEVGKPIFDRNNGFMFNGQIAMEYLGDNVFTRSIVSEPTSVGRFIENIVVFQIPTDYNVFKYDNSRLKFKSVMKKLTGALSDKLINVEQYRSFVNNFFFLNHISEICVPSMTEKSLTTDPRIPEIKAKYIAEHKDEMNDPFVIKRLEDELDKIDREYLGDDPSVTFFNGLGEKAYKIHRKKLFLMVGGIPAFDESSGKYDFNPNSLLDGWTTDVIPSIANEIRKGSYERGRETAKGGAETKLVMRVFQDLSINMDDCGTKRTIRADFKNTFRIQDFIGRMINVDGQDIIITPENMSTYDGKIVRLYSPLTCANKYNLCYKCCGQRCKEFGVKLIGIQTVKITSQFMQTAMKNMHGTVLQTMRPNLADVLL